MEVVSLSVVILVPLDEEKGPLEVFLCVGIEAVNITVVSVELDNFSVVPSEEEEATDVDRVVVVARDFPVTISVDEAMVSEIVEIGPVPDVKFEYDSIEVPISVVGDLPVVLVVVSIPEDELYVVGFVGADHGPVVELLDPEVHDDSDEDVVFVPCVILVIVVDEVFS